MIRLGTIPESVPKVFQVDRQVIVVLKDSQGRWIAMEELCSHRAGPLSEGVIVDGCVTCPWHGSRFDLADGAVTTGPARRALKVYPVQQRRGVLFVSL